jgi:hypothetical protein
MDLVKLRSITLMKLLIVQGLNIIVGFLLFVRPPIPRSTLFIVLVLDFLLIIDNAFGREFEDEALAARADDEFENKIV